MMNYKEYNAHPKMLNVKDCVIRAYCTTTHKDYIEARRELNRAKKDLGFKTYKQSGFIKKYFNKIFEWTSFPAQVGKPRITGNEFTKLYPKGNYILRMSHHLTSCIDGVIYDTWNCLDKCVYGCWKINIK